MPKPSIKICFISLDAYPVFSRTEKGVQGGAEVDTYMLATELAKDERFNVSLITGDFGQNVVESFENVTIYKTIGLRSPMAAIISIWRAMRRVNADIYFKKGASFVTALVALFCRVHGKSLILRTAQEIECDGTYIRANPLRGKAFLWTLKQAKYVFVQNDSNKKHLEQSTGVSAMVIPNGHRIHTQSGQKRDCILWAGRSAEVKGPDRFIQLAQETPLEQFVMICQQAGDDSDAVYHQLADKAKAVANLKFIERVPFHEIDSFFQRAKVLVNTSRTEGFPNVFIQACNCNTPILSLKVNPDNFLNVYNCGLCAEGDWQRFKEMLAKLLQPEIAEQYGNNARKYAEQSHNIEKIIETYKQVFIQIAEEAKDFF